MLVGAYPFERPEDKHDNQKLQKMIQVLTVYAPCSRALTFLISVAMSAEPEAKRYRSPYSLHHVEDAGSCTA